MHSLVDLQATLQTQRAFVGDPPTHLEIKSLAGVAAVFDVRNVNPR